MTRIRTERILLAIDGGEESGYAITQIITLAKSLRARVRLLHIWDVASAKETWSQAESLLGRAAGAFRLEGVEADELLGVAGKGGLGRDIESAALDWDADMVALGSRGVGDVEAVLRGSVSHEVLTQVQQPVLVLRGPPTPLVARRLLIASGGGDGAQLAATAALLAKHASEAIVLHVGRVASSMEFALIEPDERALEVAEAGAEAIRRAGISATAEVRWGPVAYSITEAAKVFECDIIVLASRPPSDLAALVLGSVTHQVIQRSHLPVLVAGRSYNETPLSLLKVLAGKSAADPSAEDLTIHLG